jgi:hypothetical protein
LIACRSRAENHRRKRGEGASIGRRRPGNEILHVLAPGGGKDREQKGGRRLASVAGCGDDAQRASADPATAALVSEGRSPTAAANDFSGGTAAVGDRARTNHQENSRAIVECIVHRDQSVGIDNDFFRQLLRIESVVKCATLLIPPSTGHAAVENSGEYGARLRNLAERARNQVSDNVRGALSLSRGNSRFCPVYGRQNLALRGPDQDASLRSATVHSDYNLTHSSDLPRSAPDV